MSKNSKITANKFSTVEKSMNKVFLVEKIKTWQSKILIKSEEKKLFKKLF